MSVVAATSSNHIQRIRYSVRCLHLLIGPLANSNVQPLAVRMLKNLGSGVEGKFQELSSVLLEHRRAFLDQAVITTEITAFQILNDVGNVVDKIDGISTQLKWVSSQFSDAGTYIVVKVPKSSI